MKQWFTKNIAKITLALASIGAITGTIGLMVGSIAHNKTSELNYYLDRNHIAIWGSQTIWTTNPKTTLEKDYKFELYFADKPKTRKFNTSNQNWYYSTDIKWDRKYPKDGYFTD